MTQNITRLLGTASLLALATPPLQAQEVFDLGEITVFANQAPTALNRTGATVDILDQQDLQQAKGETLADALDTLPGISTSSNGGLGKQTNLRIRGLGDRYVSVRINGIDVTDPASPQTQFNWGSLTTAGINRVEVLKGSQSALYGSEAIAGVVNITTAPPEEIGTTYSIGVEVGSFNTRRGDLTIASKTERGDLSFTLSQIKTDGFSAAEEDDGNTEKDGFDGVTALLSAGYELTDIIRVGVDLIYMNEDTNIDAFGGAGGDADVPSRSDRRGARAYAEINGGVVQHTIEASYFETDRYDGGSFPSAFESVRREARYRGLADLGATQLAFGAEYSEEEALFSNGRATYDVFSVFGEAQYAVTGDLDVSAALRVDDHSEFGTETTGRLAAAWRPATGTVVRGSLATGFRAPSLNELFGPFGANPGLQPETSRSAELGIEHTYSTGAVVQATAFYTEIDDLITYPVNSYQQTPGTSTTKGIEVSGRLPVTDRIDAFGSYTYTDATDADGEQLLRVPENDLVLGLSANLTDRLSGQITVNYVADRVDVLFPTPVGPMDDYTLINLTLDYAVNDTASVYLRLENLTDEQYQSTKGYGTSDRAVFVGVRATF